MSRKQELLDQLAAIKDELANIEELEHANLCKTKTPDIIKQIQDSPSYTQLEKYGIHIEIDDSKEYKLQYKAYYRGELFATIYQNLLDYTHTDDIVYDISMDFYKYVNDMMTTFVHKYIIEHIHLKPYQIQIHNVSINNLDYLTVESQLTMKTDNGQMCQFIIMMYLYTDKPYTISFIPHTDSDPKITVVSESDCNIKITQPFLPEITGTVESTSIDNASKLLKAMINHIKAL